VSRGGGDSIEELRSDMHATPRDSLVVVPTYNEAGNLHNLVSRILGLRRFDLLLVDDNSPDGTGRMANHLARAHEGRIRVLHRLGKFGLGTALVQGFEEALDLEYELIFQMDADLSHDPASLVHMRDALLDGADVVVGSRYTRGGSTTGWPASRQVLSQLAAAYTDVMLRLPLTDVTGGFRGYRRAALASLDLSRIASTGYAVQVELNYLCFLAGHRFAEVPIEFHGRTWGESKMSLAIILEALTSVASLRLRGMAPVPGHPAPSVRIPRWQTHSAKTEDR
jgi:dolichol-phosphate mannosyltransferase